METDNQIDKLREKYKRFYAEVYDCFEGQTEDFEKFKCMISKFENDLAPKLGLFPQNTEYWIDKTALLAAYAGFNITKDHDERKSFITDLLTTYGYNSNEIESINQKIDKKRHQEENLQDSGLERKI